MDVEKALNPVPLRIVTVGNRDSNTKRGAQYRRMPNLYQFNFTEKEKKAVICLHPIIFWSHDKFV